MTGYQFEVPETRSSTAAHSAREAASTTSRTSPDSLTGKAMRCDTHCRHCERGIKLARQFLANLMPSEAIQSFLSGRQTALLRRKSFLQRRAVTGLISLDAFSVRLGVRMGDASSPKAYATDAVTAPPHRMPQRWLNIERRRCQPIRSGRRRYLSSTSARPRRAYWLSFSRAASLS